MVTRVKICGITNDDDATLAARLGADLVGFIFADSPRRVSAAQAAAIASALPAFQQTVGVFVDVPPSEVVETCAHAGLDYAQLHGDESPEDCARVQEAGVGVIKVLTITSRDSLADAEKYTDVDGVLLDRPRGGPMYDWAIAAEASDVLRPPVFMAGGLTPVNVADAVAAAGPYGVDVGSGVERSPGVKDPYKLAAFLSAARA
jgi:phosphoribosylanthranilate isomerase